MQAHRLETRYKRGSMNYSAQRSPKRISYKLLYKQDSIPLISALSERQYASLHPKRHPIRAVVKSNDLYRESSAIWDADPMSQWQLCDIPALSFPRNRTQDGKRQQQSSTHVCARACVCVCDTSWMVLTGAPAIHKQTNTNKQTNKQKKEKRKQLLVLV